MTAILARDISAELARVSATVDARAAALDDKNADIRIDLAALGAANLLGLGLQDGTLPEQVAVLDEISTRSLAVGFSAWAHRMTVQYLHLAPPHLRDELLGPLSRGERVGVTAMAAGLKHVAGLGPIPIRADAERGGGLRLTGPIHWASNVFDDALIVAPAAAGDGQTYIVVLDADAHGVTVNPEPNLMALGSTASTSLQLRDVSIAADRILSTDLHGFVRNIRPTFLLLQTAFCVGVGRAALAGAELITGVLAAGFADELGRLSAESRALRSRLYELAADPAGAAIVELIRLRLDTARLALAATRLECTVTGGAGYALGNTANRRFREAAFLPIQSPSEGQLQWELTQYE